MKKLLLSFVALSLISTATVNAQEGFKGKWFALGSVGYGTEKDGDLKKYQISPVVGTFVAPTTAIGLGIGYAGSKLDEGEKKSTKKGEFTVMPLVRKYWPVTENFMIFGQAAVPLAFGKNTTEVDGTKTDAKYTGYGFQLAPGIDFFLSKNFTIEATFGVAGWSANKPKDGDATNDFDFGLRNGLNFGLKYIF